MYEELAYCVPLGIPHSKFLSWDPDDQDKAIGYTREQARVCRCGTRQSEWKDDRYAYVGQQRQCPGCEVLEQERENVSEIARGYTHVYLAKREYARLPEDEGVET